jgi:uncharacterized heparinase superfamily protein
MKKALLLFNTLRYLKWQQIYFRMLRKLIKPGITDQFQASKLARPTNWQHALLYSQKIDENSTACFLNHIKNLDLPGDWNKEIPSKLWVYNLHYFEDLLSNKATEKRNFHLHLLHSWVDHNPVGFGNGWEPYPTSLRIVNILKAWLGGLELDEKLSISVFTQASFLASDLEKHLLGNHYFVNLKALLFAGVVFGNIRWLSIAEKGLISEIPEQILEDGANFELSPMYHSLMLVDMLDMLNLSKAYPAQVPARLVSLLQDYIPRMLTFMEAMSHPDGGVSFFNDSSDGIAPEKSKIESYAEKLGFSVKPLDFSMTTVVDNASSGYFCATSNSSKLIFDAAGVGPDYIPGHAHADTLAFELSIGAQRVFVNSGTSEYGLSPVRVNQRKTASHNTIEVDEKDSSQVWSGFRVANRARIIERSSKLKLDNNIFLKATHNGYKSLIGGCYHSRELVFNGTSLVVRDELHGDFTVAKLRFYFHPDLEVILESGILLVSGKAFNLRSDLTGKKASLLDACWHPQFGIDIPNKMLLIDLLGNETETIFDWTEV